MTPEVEDRCRGQGGDVAELLAEINRLRTAAEPFIHHPAKLVSQSTDGKAYTMIEVLIEDILNLRKALKGS
jgi:hypothetical protein